VLVVSAQEFPTPHPDCVRCQGGGTWRGPDGREHKCYCSPGEKWLATTEAGDSATLVLTARLNPDGTESWHANDCDGVYTHSVSAERAAAAWLGDASWRRVGRDGGRVFTSVRRLAVFSGPPEDKRPSARRKMGPPLPPASPARPAADPRGLCASLREALESVAVTVGPNGVARPASHRDVADALEGGLPADLAPGPENVRAVRAALEAALGLATAVGLLLERVENGGERGGQQ
jgi:hypothetical protein